RVVALEERHEWRGFEASTYRHTQQQRGKAVSGVGGRGGRVGAARIGAVKNELASGVSGEEGIQLHALEIHACLELMPSANPGDLINSVPGVLRIQARARPAALARAEASDFRRVKRGDREAVAGVILIQVDLGKLLKGNL